MSDSFTNVDKVYAILADVLDVPADKLTRECEFVADLGADQLDILEIATLCGQAFDIDVAHDMDRLSSVGLLVDYINYFTSPDRAAFADD